MPGSSKQLDAKKKKQEKAKMKVQIKLLKTEYLIAVSKYKE